MQEKLDLRLPGKPDNHIESYSKIMLALITIVLIAVLINIGLIFVPIGKRQADSPGKHKELPPEARKQMALKLEKQGLYAVAAEVWQGYISALDLDNVQTARIWYRIGTLHEKSNNYVKALTSYYRSESFATVEDLAPEISRRIQECLEALGRFSALKYELADRVGIDQTKQSGVSKEAGGDTVIAEIGPQKITRADLDQYIENEIERQLYMLASYLPEDQRLKQKEHLMQQFTSNEQKRAFLNSFLLQEILYRKAVADKLAEQPEIQATLQEQKRRLLAQKLIDNTLESEIKLTESDLKTYYAAHKQDYISREQARIAHILVKDKKTAAEVRLKLAAGKSFEQLAEVYAPESESDTNKDHVLGWIENREDSQIPVIGVNPEGISYIFETSAGNVVPKDIVSPNGIHIVKVLERKDSEQKAFMEVRDEIFRTVRRQKEEEIKQRLFAQLKEEYDVVVHSAQLMQAPASNAGKKPAQTSVAP